eukprot:Gb_37359 [translate_table: standard]
MVTTEPSMCPQGIRLFEVCYGFQPVAPFEVPLVLPSPVTTHEQIEQRKATVFVEHLHKLHTQVFEILAKSQAKYKAL